MIDAGEGSYTTTFDDEDDFDPVLYTPSFSHSEKKASYENLAARSACRNSTKASEIKQKLLDRYILAVNRASFLGGRRCEICNHVGKESETDAYVIILLRKGREAGEQYCLECFETLWDISGPDALNVNGKGYSNQLLRENPKGRKIPACFMASRHAPPSDELEAYSISLANVASVDAPPTRFQQLHASVRSGCSLQATDVLTLFLWKLISRQSIKQWTGREHYAKHDEQIGVDRSTHFGFDNLGNDVNAHEARLQSLELFTGVNRSACQGANLSVVLRLAQLRSREVDSFLDERLCGVD